MLRGGKALPLYARVQEAAGPLAIVLPADGPGAPLRLPLRAGDESWAAFLPGPGGAAGEVAAFGPRVADAHETTNILFSSGTTVSRACVRTRARARALPGSLRPLHAAPRGAARPSFHAPALASPLTPPPPPHPAPHPRASPRRSPGAT